jgi:hypothetical protein
VGDCKSTDLRLPYAADLVVAVYVLQHARSPVYWAGLKVPVRK